MVDGEGAEDGKRDGGRGMEEEGWRKRACVQRVGEVHGICKC